LIHTLPGLIIGAFWSLGCLFAIAKGDQIERWGGVFLLVAWLMSLLTRATTGVQESALIILAIDIVSVFFLGALAWKSTRAWPVWATALQSIAAATHIAYALDLRISVYAYMAVQNLAAYGVIGALIVGSWMAWREREALKPPTDMFGV
jgi:hypothetical protein